MMPVMSFRIRPALVAVGVAAVLSAVLSTAMGSAPAGAQQLPASVPLAALREQADAGVAAAQFELAERYQAGAGVLQDFRAATALYRLAGAQGHAGAQARLGQAHHAGLGVARDQGEALRWLRAAADQGDPQHLFDLGQALEQGADGSSDPAAAIEFYTRAADAGHIEAAVSLGTLYQNGTGVAQDFARALALYRAPIETGHARAMNNLGLLYVRGNGVAQDYEAAAQLFAAAAEQGLPTAMANLATMYANGLGVAQSDDTAEAWEIRASQARQDTGLGPAAEPGAGLCRYDPRLAAVTADPETLRLEQQAAAAGDPVAQFLQGWRACNGADTPPDLRVAAHWFQAAADRGHAPAMANLGLLYIRGQGVLQDYVLGHMWLTLASSAGMGWSTAHSAALRQRMTSTQINEAQSRAASRWESLQSR